ncbi:hypothetical protein GOODEAATRI_004856, partial [Goodea atripinnis]
TKHKTMLEARSGDGTIKSFPRIGVKSKTAAPSEPSTGLQNKTFHCEICDVHVNSETQLKQHISSRRHKDRAAGKPAKPKFSPYTPTQQLQTNLWRPVSYIINFLLPLLPFHLCRPFRSRPTQDPTYFMVSLSPRLYFIQSLDPSVHHTHRFCFPPSDPFRICPRS